jgi:hypothetical protein
MCLEGRHMPIVTKFLLATKSGSIGRSDRWLAGLLGWRLGSVPGLLRSHGGKSVNKCYRPLFCREPCPPAVKDLLQAETREVLMLPINGHSHQHILPWAKVCYVKSEIQRSASRRNVRGND